MNRLALVITATPGLLLGCESETPPEPEPPKQGSGMSAAERAALQAGGRRATTAKGTTRGGGAKRGAPTSAATGRPVATVPVSPDDPLKGKFSLADATKGLAGDGKLFADIQTDKGKLDCELYDDKAPITVANFVGLARGLRPWKNPSGKWVKEPAYDGTVFHRIIPGFMIQGGDAHGTGAGSPGYVIPDEVWAGARHDQPGLLCMANRGPNTNGAQFFILDGKAPHLDSGYTIFGKCEPTTLVTAIASSPRRGDRATDPVKIEKVTIVRGK